MTRQEKMAINRLLRNRYHDCRYIRYHGDHSVHCTVADFPGSANARRIFAGWDGELLAQAQRACV